jgi:GrpB-like predicted nucleotidyltransferase (UPF0157 family)
MRLVQIELAVYDPAWPARFEAERGLIVGALGSIVREIHHVGSTAVPGLAAKPTIDIALAVPDSADELAYRSALEAVGYDFVLREPDWFEHRLLRREPRLVNLHVFTAGCSEIVAMVGFRDRLRTDATDRDLYERTKRDLAVRQWDTVQDYADAKTDVVGTIEQRAGLS